MAMPAPSTAPGGNRSTTDRVASGTTKHSTVDGSSLAPPASGE